MAFCIIEMRTNVYIDGFNLYYRALKGTPYKWLDIAALCLAVLRPSYSVERINYYTAHVSGRVDPQAPKRQHAYLRALETLPNVTIHYGNFLAQRRWAGLVQPPEFRPAFDAPIDTTLTVARVWRTEEKGSDVNLGVHLVRDAALKRMQAAAVLTNDTDLVEPLRIAGQEFGIPVTLLAPVAKPATSLARLASDVRHIRPYIGPCQFPAALTTAFGKVIRKPEGW